MTIKVGDVFPTTKGGNATVIEIHSYRLVTVKFNNTGYTAKVDCCSLRRGDCKDPYAPSVYGVGYIGEKGEGSTINGKVNRSYSLWRSMLKRCYSSKYNPSYHDCTVAPEWFNFQTFAQDIKNLEGYQNWLNPESRFQIDKDIKIPGNRVYSKDTCKFVPQIDNIHEAAFRRLPGS